MGMYDRSLIEISVHTACVWEATSRKVGNVHQYADFVGTSYLNFVLSAGAIMGVLGNAARIRRVGVTVNAAVKETRERVGNNTNLGIVILLVPLASTWEATMRGHRHRYQSSTQPSNLTTLPSDRKVAIGETHWIRKLQTCVWSS